MLLGIIGEIERLHNAAAERRLAPGDARIEVTLARCLQELRALAALEARRPDVRRPPLRIV